MKKYQVLTDESIEKLTIVLGRLITMRDHADNPAIRTLLTDSINDLSKIIEDVKS
jgi:hypothetical protein